MAASPVKEQSLLEITERLCVLQKSRSRWRIAGTRLPFLPTILRTARVDLEGKSNNKDLCVVSEVCKLIQVFRFLNSLSFCLQAGKRLLFLSLRNDNKKNNAW